MITILHRKLSVNIFLVILCSIIITQGVILYFTFSKLDKKIHVLESDNNVQAKLNVSVVQQIDSLRKTDGVVSSMTTEISEMQINQQRLGWRQVLNWDQGCEDQFQNTLKNTSYKDQLLFGIKVYQISQSAKLVKVLCDRAAYQDVYKVYYLNNEDNSKLELAFTVYEKDATGKYISKTVNTLVGLDTWFPETKLFQNYYKLSSGGNCGSVGSYKIEKGKAVLDIYLERSVCDGDQNAQFTEVFLSK